MMTIASMEFSDEALDIFIEPSLVCTLACTWLAPVQSVDNYRLLDLLNARTIDLAGVLDETKT